MDADLQRHLRDVQSRVGSVKYVQVMSTSHLYEVPDSCAGKIPGDWELAGTRKGFKKYTSEELKDLVSGEWSASGPRYGYQARGERWIAHVASKLRHGEHNRCIVTPSRRTTSEYTRSRSTWAHSPGVIVRKAGWGDAGSESPPVRHDPEGGRRQIRRQRRSRAGRTQWQRGRQRWQELCRRWLRGSGRKGECGGAPWPPRRISTLS